AEAFQGLQPWMSPSLEFFVLGCTRSATIPPSPSRRQETSVESSPISRIKCRNICGKQYHLQETAGCPWGSIISRLLYCATYFWAGSVLFLTFHSAENSQCSRLRLSKKHPVASRP